MKVKRFEDLIAWQKAQDLAVKVFLRFKDSKDYAFRDQIWRAVISISNNIAEGFERNTTKDFIHFLVMARTSNNEVKSMIYLAKKITYLSENEEKDFINNIEEISRILNALINSLKNQT